MSTPSIPDGTITGTSWSEAIFDSNQETSTMISSSTRQGRQRRRQQTVMVWTAASVVVVLLVVGSGLIAWSLISSSRNDKLTPPTPSSPSIDSSVTGTSSNKEPTSVVLQSSTKPSQSPTGSLVTTTLLPTALEAKQSLKPSSLRPTVLVEQLTSLMPSTQAATTTRPTLQPATGLKTASEEPTHDPIKPASSILECLWSIQGLSVVTTANDNAVEDEYDDARVCLVYPPPSTTTAQQQKQKQQQQQDPLRPLAIVQPTTVEDAALVVACAAQFPPTTVSARSGAHSFTASSCRGTIILDLQRLDSFEVVQPKDDDDTALVTWGAGQLHGQVYGKLLLHNLIIPGGAEVMVGTGGLWLGCGRGPLTQAFGLSCDQVQSVEYIDSKGVIRTADQDLLWMAKGSGNLFPGIVTKFTARAYAMPEVVYKESCYFPNTAAIVKAAVRTYTMHLDEMNDSNRSMFGALIVERPHVKLEFNCFGCDSTSTELQNLLQLEREMLGEIQNAGVETPALCESNEYRYGDFLLQSTMWDTYEAFEDFQSRSQWPEWKDYWGQDLKGYAYNGGILVPNDWSFTEDLMDAIVEYTQTLPGNATARTFLDYFSIYPLKGRGSDSVEVGGTAYGGRSSKAVIHYKKDKVESDPAMFKQHMDNFERTLVESHGLPCRGFYNYMDEDLSCATNDDEWLNAFFSDPTRIRAIVQAHDPNHVFFRLRL